MPSTFPFRLLGRTYAIPLRYAPGHRLTPAEAQVMNSRLAEAIRRRLGAAGEPAGEATVHQAFATFEFSLATRGPGAPDPVDIKAWELAEAEARAGGQGDNNEYIGQMATSPGIRAEAERLVRLEAAAAARALAELAGGPG